MHLSYRLAGTDAAAALTLLLTCMIAAPTGAQLATPGLGAELADAPGRAIYAASCANCHGLDGTGLDRSLVAFEEELPDFTDCDFAAREPGTGLGAPGSALEPFFSFGRGGRHSHALDPRPASRHIAASHR